MNFPGQLTSILMGIEDAAFLSASGAIVSAAKHQFNTTMRIAATEAKMIDATVNALYPFEIGAP